MAEKKQYFWNKKGECFAGKHFGEDVTADFQGDEDRIKEYLELGKIVSSEPADFDQAKESELNALRKKVESLQTENKGLKASPKKSTPSPKVKDLEAQLKASGDQLKDSEAQLKASDVKVKDLEAQVETLTKPGK